MASISSFHSSEESAPTRAPSLGSLRRSLDPSPISPTTYDWKLGETFTFLPLSDVTIEPKASLAHTSTFDSERTCYDSGATLNERGNLSSDDNDKILIDIVAEKPLSRGSKDSYPCDHHTRRQGCLNWITNRITYAWVAAILALSLIHI